MEQAIADPAMPSRDDITVGGFIEVLGGTSDHDGGVDGFSRGHFSRIYVNYDTVLDNGLTVAGRIAYTLNQRGSGARVTATSLTGAGTRMDAAGRGDPDVLYVGVGGGFGTIFVGAHATASSSTLPRPIGFVGGVNTTHYVLFSGITPTNATFSEYGYGGSPETVTYSTPDIGGFEAKLSFTPDTQSDQGTTLANAQDEADNIEDRVDVAAKWSGAMGAMNASIGVGYQSGANDALDAFSVSGTVGFGGFTLGAAWFDNDLGARTVNDLTEPYYNGDDEDALNMAATAFLDAREDGEPKYADPLIRARLGAVHPDPNVTVLADPSASAVQFVDPDAANANPNPLNSVEELGAGWRNEQNGWSIAGKYDLGSLSLGVTYSRMERDRFHGGDLSSTNEFEATILEAPTVNMARATTDRGEADLTHTVTGPARDVEESALVLKASYAIGGGLTAWVEYMDLEQSYTQDRLVETTRFRDGFPATGGTQAIPADGDWEDMNEIVTEFDADLSGPMAASEDDSLFMVGVSLSF